MLFSFYWSLSYGEEFIKKWAFIPSRFLSHKFSDFITIFTSMFMHAGLGHIAGNMLYLWIFGDNVEDRMGKLPFLLFYIVCGMAATFSQTLFNPESSVPNVGASGAIAGILGAYIMLFPRGKVNVMAGRLIQMPALIVIGFWFVAQFASQVGELASANDSSGGVAYMAHIGGFIAGLLITWVYNKRSSIKS
jgi:membrane associated rhomboid family serine protease